MPAPPQYRFVEGPAEAESLADVPWWQVIEDPQLQALIREAIANNLDLRVATARVEEARAQYGIAQSFLFPEVGVAGGYSAQQVSRLSEPPQGTAAAQDLPELERRLPALLGDRPLRPPPAREGGRVRRLPGDASRAGAASLVTLVADVASTYFPAARARPPARDRPAHRCSSNDETVRFYENRLEGGVSNRLEVDQAVANRARTAAVIPQTRAADRARGERALRSCSAACRGRSSAARRWRTSSVPPAIPAGLPASLLERRPDVLGAEQLLVAANANVGAAKALFFPTISLTGLLGAISGDFSNLAEGRLATSGR